VRRRLPLLLCAALLALPAQASAADPGRWLLTGWSSVPFAYWQGVTAPPAAGRLFFAGPREGLYRTAASLRQTAALDAAIPAQVKATEGYDHIGDISWHPAEGGRVLLPLECYTPGGPNGGNLCGTGSIGVADPTSLGFRYYVKLDPAEIAKAMWVEASPDGELLWTSSGPDLLAYRAADVSPANAAPAGAPIRAVRRLPGAVPPSGVTGATFRRGRLFLAGRDRDAFQIWSVDVADGTRRLELELPRVMGEAQGLHATRLLGGELHWLIAPLAAEPTFGPRVGLLHLAPRRGRARLRVRLVVRRADTLRPRVAIRVTRRGAPVRGASVSFAGLRSRTDARGRARGRALLGVPGSFSALARKGRLRGMSRRLRVGFGAEDAAAGASAVGAAAAGAAAAGAAAAADPPAPGRPGAPG
jgi:hypothetical protein